MEKEEVEEKRNKAGKKRIKGGIIFIMFLPLSPPKYTHCPKRKASSLSLYLLKILKEAYILITATLVSSIRALVWCGF